jgi:hypothetical protein
MRPQTGRKIDKNNRFKLKNIKNGAARTTAPTQLRGLINEHYFRRTIFFVIVFAS